MQLQLQREREKQEQRLKIDEKKVLIEEYHSKLHKKVQTLLIAARGAHFESHNKISLDDCHGYDGIFAKSRCLKKASQGIW